MARWVLLRHELPDGSWHHDWMMERDGDGGGLLTFRLGPEVQWPPRGRFTGVRLADHRRDYLTYEGPVSGGRGRVARVDSGEARMVLEDARLGITGEAWTVRGRATGRAAEGEVWRFEETSGQSGGGAGLED